MTRERGYPSIAVLEGGTYYHHFTITDPRYAPYFSACLYAPELDQINLEPFDAVVVADRVHSGLLHRHAHRLLEFADWGRTLVVLGEVAAHTWLPGARWSYRPTNFWWWLDKDADLGVRLGDSQHSLFRYVTLADLTWHYHGVFHPPEGAVSLAVVQEDGEYPAGAILYEDTVSTRGRLLVTCLDPFYHHGSNFMPAASRFLSGVLNWLRHEVALQAPSGSI